MIFLHFLSFSCVLPFGTFIPFALYIYAIIVMFIFMHTIHPLSEGRKQRPEDRFSLQAEFRTSIEYSAT